MLTLSQPARFLYSHADAHRSTTALGAPTMQLAADVRLCFLHGWCQRSDGHGFCDRVWARSPIGGAAGRTVPLSLRLPSRKESRGAGATLLCFLEGAANHQSQAARTRTCAACASDLAPREQALRGQGTREVNARSAEGREPLPRSPAFCAGAGRPRQRLGRVASRKQSRFGTATTVPLWPGLGAVAHR